MSQESSSVITEYLLDTQPGLAKVIASTTGGNTTRFVHDPMGIHSQENPNGDWLHMVKDGLGSVRQVFDDNLSELYAAEYAPYGEVWNSSGTEQTPFAFTGEMLDDNGLQYHRARYLDPSLGVWMSLDPLETANRYGYVSGNPVNFIDRSGLFNDTPEDFVATCQELPPHTPCLSLTSQCERECCMIATYSPDVTMRGCLASHCPPQTGTSSYGRCNDFINEITQFISSFEQNQGAMPPGLRQYALLQALAVYYSDIKLTEKVSIFGRELDIWRPVPSPQVNPGFERYGPINLQFGGADIWRNFIPEIHPTVDASWNTYGFRRPYFGNTHHYFLYLWMLYESPIDELVFQHNKGREIDELRGYLAENGVSRAQDLTGEQELYYAWLYQEAVYDLYIVEEHAPRALRSISNSGFGELPSILENEFCADREGDIWSLENRANQYYYDLPEELIPDEEFHPRN